MEVKEYDKYMKGFMIDKMVIPQETYIALHIDGDNFSKFTEKFEKPFDGGFHEAMMKTAEYLFKEFNAMIAYVQFDEINLILPKEYEAFSRNLGKLISKASALATVTFGNEMEGFMPDEPYYGFATHVYMLPSFEHVEDYMNWRKSDCEKNALNTVIYWTLRNEGNSPKRCASLMNKSPHWQKLEWLDSRDAPFGELEYWKRRGSPIFWIKYPREYVDYKTGETKTTPRRKPYVVDDEGMYDCFMREFEGE